MSYIKYPRYQIGEQINDNGRDMIVLEKEKRLCGRKAETYIHYKCNICGGTNWVRETALHRGVNCAICKSIKTVRGINDIAKTHPEYIKYFANKEDAYKYSIKSNAYTRFECPKCGFQKTFRINAFFTNINSCPICYYCASLLEKVMIVLLMKYDIYFEYQASKGVIEWAKDKVRYDFYFPYINTILEIDGAQHFLEDKYRMYYRTCKEVKAIDKKKEELAKQNGILNYLHFQYDMLYLNRDYYYQVLLNSGLLDLLHLSISETDFNEIYKDALLDTVKPICDYYEKTHNITEVEKEFGHTSIWVKYRLNIGRELKITSYAPVGEYSIYGEKKLNPKSKPIVITTPEGRQVYFDSMRQASINSVHEFGIEFSKAIIYKAVHKGIKPYGYQFDLVTVEQ